MQHLWPQDPSVRAARDLLGVDAEADSDQLARAYRRQARLLHPDVSLEPDATERFSALQSAYHLVLETLQPHDPPPTTAATRGERRRPGAVRDTTPVSAGSVPISLGVRHVPWLVAGPVRVQPHRHGSDVDANSPEQH